MIGTLDTKIKEATIIGAGISGLLIGYTLKRKGYRVTILESSNRVGGLIETKQTPFGPAEAAAHSIMVTHEIRHFFEELGVELIPVNVDAKARYIYRSGKMRRMPLTFGELLHTLIRFFSKPKLNFDTEKGSLADWCLAYLGKPALQFLLSPFVTGVFAATPEELNLSISFSKLSPKKANDSLFKQFFTGKKQKSSRPTMMAPKGGMGVVIAKLSAALKDEIQLNHPVESLPEVPNLILSVPAPVLAALILSKDPTSAKMLNAVTYSPLITVTCFYEESSFRKSSPKGVGVLIPRQEGLRILGVLFNSSAFSGRVNEQNLASLTVMIGGTTDPACLQIDEATFPDLINQELGQLLGSRAPAVHMEITRWNEAIPIYSHALKEAQHCLSQGFCSTPGRIVFTNYSREVSIRSIVNAALKANLAL
jgi:oxygen-dependent protoporphyrinogen oxidase